MTFFWKTVSGKILNRFSNDMSQVDQVVGHTCWPISNGFVHVASGYIALLLPIFLLTFSHSCSHSIRTQSALHEALLWTGAGSTFALLHLSAPDSCRGIDDVFPWSVPVKCCRLVVSVR